MHLQLHNETLTYKCTECSRLFNSKSNMVKHHKNMHNKICNVCSRTFSSPELRNAHYVEHLSSYYMCQFCNKVMKLRSSLQRHLKKQHRQDSADVGYNKANKTFVPEAKNFGTESLLVNSQERALNFSDLDVDLSTNFDMPQNNDGQEVCLLSNTDEGLTLGNDF